jgi:hypothetical protein
MRRETAHRLRILVAGSFLLNCLVPNALGQTPTRKATVISEADGKVRVAADDPRPLDRALDALQGKYGWRINYEDPQYISKLDLADPKASSEGRPEPGGGSFVVEFPATPNTTPDEQKTLQIVVDAYNQSKNPGRFELRHGDPEQFDVVATAAHDEKGNLSKQEIVLDLPVMIPSGDRTVAETVDLICQKVAEKSHIAVALGVHPMGLDRQHATIGGKEMPARAYISATTEPTGRKISWRLLYDPDSKSYVLNLHQTRVPPPPKPPTPSPAPSSAPR